MGARGLIRERRFALVIGWLNFQSAPLETVWAGNWSDCCCCCAKLFLNMSWGYASLLLYYNLLRCARMLSADLASLEGLALMRKNRQSSCSLFCILIRMLCGSSMWDTFFLRLYSNLFTDLHAITFDTHPVQHLCTCSLLHPCTDTPLFG